MAREITNVSEIKRLFALPSVAESRVSMRDPAHVFGNQRTEVVPGLFLRDAGSAMPPIDAREVFRSCYPELRQRMRCHKRLGVLALAIDEKRNIIGHAWLKATPDRTRSAIIGRHSMCDLAIPDAHGDVSLRHMVMLARAVSHDEVRLRLLDLRTAIGFADEQGRLLRAVSSEGSLFLRIGRVVLMLMVTGDEVELPDDPEDAYACVPERVFLSEREGVLGMERPRKRGDSPWSAQSSVTFVRAHRGPLAVAAELCSDLEMQQGVVVVRTDSGVVRRPVSLGALQRGILIGRYSRCDVGLRGADDSRLSRVHLMIIQDGDELLAVDTASTNGTKYQQREILLKRLEDGDLLRLGGELEIAWHRAA